MSGQIANAFAEWLEAGGRLVGQVWVEPLAEGGYRLCHADDVERVQRGTGSAGGGLEAFHRPADARQLATYDDAGNYRPLKTAANLRHGWVLTLSGFSALAEALDFFYPSVLGVWVSRERLRITPLRETLERQSGMYAVTKQISDVAAQGVIGQLCRSGAGCLKTILWEIRPGLPVEGREVGAHRADGFPFLCNEACNLLVAAIRDEVKKK